MTTIPPWVAALIGLVLGFGLRQLHHFLEDRRRRRTMHTITIPIGGLAAFVAFLERSHSRRNGDMRLSVAVGGKMTREAWATVSWKLLDLVNATLSPKERAAVVRYIDVCGRAWPDLEQRATAEAPGQQPPPAPTI